MDGGETLSGSAAVPEIGGSEFRQAPAPPQAAAAGRGEAPPRVLFF